MEAFAVVFIILFIGILLWMLIDRSWLDDWFGVKVYSDEPTPEQAVIRMWPKPKPVFYDVDPYEDDFDGAT